MPGLPFSWTGYLLSDLWLSEFSTVDSHDTSFCFHGSSLVPFASTVLSAELLEELCENQQSFYLLLKGSGLWAVPSPPLTATGLEASEVGLTLLQSLLEMFIQELSDLSV